MKKLFIVLLLLFAAVSSYASTITASISAQNTFSGIINLGSASGAVLTLSGTWTATVTLQRQDNNGNWIDITDNNGNVVAITSDGTYTVFEPTSTAKYRFGVKTGNYTSGTVVGLFQYANPQ